MRLIKLTDLSQAADCYVDADAILCIRPTPLSGSNGSYGSWVTLTRGCDNFTVIVKEQPNEIYAKITSLVLP